MKSKQQLAFQFADTEPSGKCERCGKPFGKRGRCYYCKLPFARVRNGEYVPCGTCGKMIYAQPNQIANGEKRFCSRPCYHVARRGVERVKSGRRYISARGHIMVKTGYRKYKMEHHLVAEIALGRNLTSDEVVRHRNGNLQDNRLENLEVMTWVEHRRIYQAKPELRVKLNCGTCGIEYTTNLARVNRSHYCSKSCAAKGNGERRRLVQGQAKRTSQGYIYVYYPTHPGANSLGWVMEHRLVAEQKYGRFPLPSEHVHHINGIKNDNRPENLEILDATDHCRISQGQAVVKRRKEKAELHAYRRKFGPLEE